VTRAEAIARRILCIAEGYHGMALLQSRTEPA
jgi:hypothetical protein